MKLSVFLISPAVLLYLLSFNRVWCSPFPGDKAATPQPGGTNTSTTVAAPENGNTKDTVGGGTGEDGGIGSDGPIKLNVTGAKIFNVPPRRPYTKYETGKSREFNTVRIIPGDTPCNFKKYFFFFGQSSQLNLKPADLLRRAIFTSNETDYYLYDPEDLCIFIEDELNIDIYNYDCGRMGICTCGLYYSYVDPNVPQPEPISHIRTYMAVNGLDRKLVVEQEICVSGLAGHCTLENSTSLEKLYCKSTMECVLDDSYGPILTNQITLETYGICLPKKPVAPLGDNFRSADYSRGMKNTLHCRNLMKLIMWITLLQKVLL